jgi:hypothetical protein
VLICSGNLKFLGLDKVFVEDRRAGIYQGPVPVTGGREIPDYSHRLDKVVGLIEDVGDYL